MKKLQINSVISEEVETSDFAKPRLCAGDECPVCQNGEMVEETEMIFGQPNTILRCDGLLDPGDENKPLAACPHTQEIAAHNRLIYEHLTQQITCTGMINAFGHNN